MTLTLPRRRSRKPPPPPIEWIYDDGGRSEAGFKGTAGDCAVRAIAIATGQPYAEVYQAFEDIFAEAWYEEDDGPRPKAFGPDNGTLRWMNDTYLIEKLGWRWTPTMLIGSGCRVHLRRDELPSGPLVARVSKHLVAVVNGIVYDTYDPSRGGTRCVYGMWTP